MGLEGEGSGGEGEGSGVKGEGSGIGYPLSTSHCCVALPRNAMCWSTEGDCSIS